MLLILVCVQMDAKNLAIMFGPALMRPEDDDITTMLKDMKDQSKIVKRLIRRVSNRHAFHLARIAKYLFVVC